MRLTKLFHGLLNGILLQVSYFTINRIHTYDDHHLLVWMAVVIYVRCSCKIYHRKGLVTSVFYPKSADLETNEWKSTTITQTIKPLKGQLTEFWLFVFVQIGADFNKNHFIWRQILRRRHGYSGEEFLLFYNRYAPFLPCCRKPLYEK